MKFISHEQMKTENLEWGELIAPNEHSKFWHHEIVYSTGQVHIGVVYENGAVETACAKWDGIDTFERFQGRPILHYYGEYANRTLHWNQDANQLFCEESYRNSCDIYIHQVAGSELLEWFLAATEDDLIELPESGHVSISLPAELREKIAQVAAAENQSLKDWVVSRLSESAEDERSRASLAQAAERRNEFKEVLNRIRASRASAE
jgi:hypothetical protein